MEAEKAKNEAALAMQEATKREADRKRAHEEQTKAIAAAKAAKTKARGGKEPEESDTEEASDPDDDDDDEDWNAEEKAKFLAEAKKEVAKKKVLMQEKKKKEDEARKRLSAVKAADKVKKEAREAARETAEEPTPDFIVAIESEGFDGDEELEEDFGDFIKVRDYVSALQARKMEAEEHESDQIQQVENKLYEEKQAYRTKASQGIALYTADEAEDIERQAAESKQIIASLRKDNQKIRDNVTKMKEEMRSLYVHNQRLEESKKTTEEFQSQLTSFEDKESGKQEQLESMATKYKDAIEEHQEALEMRTMSGESENNIKRIYDRLTNRLVVKFQAECDDDVLVLELGSIALGEIEGDEEDDGGDETDGGDSAALVSRSFHQQSGDEDSGSEYPTSDEEEEEVDSDDEGGIN